MKRVRKPARLHLRLGRLVAGTLYMLLGVAIGIWISVFVLSPPGVRAPNAPLIGDLRTQSDKAPDNQPIQLLIWIVPDSAILHCELIVPRSQAENLALALPDGATNVQGASLGFLNSHDFLNYFANDPKAKAQYVDPFRKRPIAASGSSDIVAIGHAQIVTTAAQAAGFQWAIPSSSDSELAHISFDWPGAISE